MALLCQKIMSKALLGFYGFVVGHNLKEIVLHRLSFDFHRQITDDQEMDVRLC